MLRSVVSRYYVEGTSLAFGQLSSTVMPLEKRDEKIVAHWKKYQFIVTMIAASIVMLEYAAVALGFLTANKLSLPLMALALIFGVWWVSAVLTDLNQRMQRELQAQLAQWKEEMTQQFHAQADASVPQQIKIAKHAEKDIKLRLHKPIIYVKGHHALLILPLYLSNWSQTQTYDIIGMHVKVQISDTTLGQFSVTRLIRLAEQKADQREELVLDLTESQVRLAAQKRDLSEEFITLELACLLALEGRVEKVPLHAGSEASFTFTIEPEEA